MSCFTLRKQDLDRLVKTLGREWDIHAPVKKQGVTNFEKVKDAGDIVLHEHSYLPLKRMFFRPRETLFRFDRGKLSVPENKERKKIILGAKRCDLNSIMRQDIMFLGETNDVYYKNQRENTLLIGYQCKSAFDKYCFCGSLDLEDCQDLMLYDRGPVFLVEATSDKGESFAKKYMKFFTETDSEPTNEEKIIKNADRLRKKDISHLYDSGKWKEGVDQCLSCAACVLLCPSCYCFDIEDENDMNLKSGRRVRNHSSCQLKSFTKVADGHIFRESREDRFKHRIFHQLQWFRERHGMNLCTGCGRCIRFCPTRIDFVEMINRM